MTASLPYNGVTRSVRIAETVLWTGAALFVLAAHVGGAAWLMREQPIIAADDIPPAAIMIELADDPEAVNTEENEISETVQDTEASTPAEQIETPKEKPPEELAEEQVKPEPVEKETVEDDEPVKEELPQLSNVAVPLPAAQPKPPEPKQEIVKEEKPKKPEPRKSQPRPQRQQAASQNMRKAQVQVREGARTAARQSASGVSAATSAQWQSRLMAHLERRKRYPGDARSRGERGTVYVRFSIDSSGNVGSVSLARSSGFSALDNEVLSLVRRASPVPAPPPGANKTITAPVRFSVR